MSRRLATVGGVALIALAACTPHDELQRFAKRATFRRELLLASLVGESRYVQTRRAHYATGDALDWNRHEEWNPPTRRLGVAGDRPTALNVDELPLLELGRLAFFRYPAQLTPYVARATASPQSFGLWQTAEQGTGGLVEVTLVDGKTALALTCASCHARVDHGALQIGAANRELDVGALLAAEAADRDPELAATRRAWGKGKVDVSSIDGDEPVAIPDLRAVRYQTHLQYSGAIAQTSVLALALRVETLLITAQGGAVRPPPRVALALATYLESLAPPLPHADTTSDGARVFAHRCAGCHRGAERAGPPVPVEQVGTDPTAARSPNRGTGGYRAPSLIGVGDRAPLLHDGSAPTLTALLDPSRVGGHAFTRGLTNAEVSALHDFLVDAPNQN